MCRPWDIREESQEAVGVSRERRRSRRALKWPCLEMLPGDVEMAAAKCDSNQLCCVSSPELWGSFGFEAFDFMRDAKCLSSSTERALFVPRSANGLSRWPLPT